MIRESLEYFYQLGYYYGSKLGGGEGQAARPQGLSGRVAIKPVAQAYQPVPAQGKHCGKNLIHDKIKD